MGSDCNIDGIGTISAGEYGIIQVDGSGKCIGEIKAEEIIVSGVCKTERVKCNKLNIDGSYKGLDFTAASNLLINGLGKFEESLAFNKAKVNGVCKVENNCEGTEFISDGVINIGGMLSADNIDITLRNKCMVKEIGGEKISVKTGRYKSRKIFGFSFSSTPLLVSEIIEGDEIFLENTHCKVVRGDKVIIGKGCTIENIEYRTSIQINENSSVNNSISI